MATTSSIGTSSRNYSTVASWLAAFTSGGWIGETYNDTEFSISSSISFSGHSTSATNFIKLTTAAGQSFRDNASAQTNALKYNVANGVGIKGTIFYAALIIVAESWVTVEKLQLQQNGAGNGTAIYSCFTGGLSGVVADGLIEELDSASFGAVQPHWQLSGIVKNTLVINRCKDGNGIGLGYGGSQSAVNCTVVRPSDQTVSGSAFNSISSGAHVINCAGFGFTNFQDTSGNFAGSNNCSDKTIGFGTSNQASKTYASQFVTTTESGRDFKTKTGADLLNNSATDTTDIPAAIDIVGTARPQGAAWDIGCWELVATATTAALAALSALKARAKGTASAAAAVAAQSSSRTRAAALAKANTSLGARAWSALAARATGAVSVGVAARITARTRGAVLSTGAIPLGAKAGASFTGRSGATVAAALRGISAVATKASAGPSLAAALLGRAGTASAAKAASTVKVTLAAVLAIAVKATVLSKGALPLLARSAVAVVARGFLVGPGALFARMASAVRGGAMPRVASAIGGAAGIVTTGRATVSPRAGIAAQASAQTGARSTAGVSAAIGGRAQHRTKATGDAKYRAAMSATTAARVAARVTSSGVTGLLGRIGTATRGALRFFQNLLKPDPSFVVTIRVSRRAVTADIRRAVSVRAPMRVARAL